MMLVASLQPHGAGKVAVFAAPWGVSAAEIIGSSGGRLVSTSASGWLAIVDLESDDGVSGLYAGGALFVASTLVAKACLGLGIGSGDLNNEE